MQTGSTPISLIDAVKRREQEAWKRLLFLYSPLVDHWCRLWGVYGPDVEDIRQEVFQSVSTGLESFRRDRPSDTFRGWMRVITRRKFLDYCRRQKRQPQAQGGSEANLLIHQLPSEDDDEALSHVDPSDEVVRLHHRALELIRSQFEEKTWQAFWRTAVDGQSPIDVAKAMNSTPAAVRKAKSRVLHRLKTELGDLLG